MINISPKEDKVMPKGTGEKLASYPQREWGRVAIAGYGSGPSYWLLNPHDSQSYNFVYLHKLYVVTVTLLPLEGKNRHGVQVLEDGVAVVKPDSYTWRQIWKHFQATT